LRYCSALQMRNSSLNNLLGNNLPAVSDIKQLIASFSKYELGNKFLSHYTGALENDNKYQHEHESRYCQNQESKSVVKERIVYTENKPNETCKESGETEKMENPNNQPEYYEVSEKDKMFWCFYMIVKGQTPDTLPLPNDRFAVQSQFKCESVELLSRSDNIPWKTLKLVKSNILSSLGDQSGKSMKLTDLVALSHLYETNVIYVWDKFYTRIHGNPKSDKSDSWSIIVKDRNGEHLVNTQLQTDYLKTIENTHYEVIEPSKPIKSISAYKISELRELAEKLDIETVNSDGKHLIKKDLYAIIQSRFVEN